MEILLNKYKSKKSTNVNKSVYINLIGKNRLLPLDNSLSTINESKLYDNERSNSNIIRLTCTINPICSNVLFNNITEIISYEGSDNCKSLNYTSLVDIKNNGNNLVYKSKDMFKTSSDAIRDTQLSNTSNGFTYHCGLDIFNNHILRSNTFKTVCKFSNNGHKESTFNTILDFMRNIDGNVISGYSDAYIGTQNPDIPLHLYLADDILPFKNCIEARLIDKNGWLGFVNIGKFGTYDENNAFYDIYKVINSKKSCDFIDMYPSRDLWYFTPKYNKYRQRIEKNWNYCITYPSSQTTNVDFINNDINSLKITMFEDNFINKNGTIGIKIYSISKHGLIEGDVINLYINNSIKIQNATVISIFDDYTYSIYTDNSQISNNWVELTIDELKNGRFVNDNINYIIKGDKYKFAIKENNENIKYPILPNNKINLDDSVLNLSYKKVVDGEELKYYVRIFSRLPNWKYSNIKPTKSELYKPNSKLIFNNQTIDNEFESHTSKLAFAKNIYNDDISEIVFTDDIDISNLKDNLGRPLTDLYLTIIKNNQGYRNWYGISKTLKNNEEETKIVTNTSDIEYSHCFGKINCAFQLSKESLWDENIKNVLNINRIDKKLGLKNLNSIENIPIDVDEIQYNKVNEYHGDVLFYGDLCSYSTKLLDEYVIQPIYFRFNTAQRELMDGDTAYKNFKTLFYDEITKDDYDNLADNPQDNFEITTYEIDNVCQRKEGYVYIPHYKIPIKTFSDTISIQKPYYISIKNINDSLDEIYTLSKHNFNLYDKFIIRIINKETNKTDYIYCEVTEIIDYRRFKFKTIDEIVLNKDIIMKYGKIVKGGDDIPEYATLSTDGSCYYMWREVIPNGYDSENKVETYPFTNGALYVNKHINLFVKRQDPNGYGGLQSITYPYDKDSNILNKTEENNYYQEEDIQC